MDALLFVCCWLGAEAGLQQDGCFADKQPPVYSNILIFFLRAVLQPWPTVRTAS